MSEIPLPGRRSKNEHYPNAVRQQAVRLVEGGMPRRDVLRQFGMSATALRDWRRDYASGQLTCPMPFPRFTRAQRDHVAQQLLDGRLTPDEALRKHGLRLKRTLRIWVAEYQASQAAAQPPAPVGAAGPPPPASPDPRDAATLAAQLHQAQWQLKALELLIDQAEARYHIDIRKKGGAKRST